MPVRQHIALLAFFSLAFFLATEPADSAPLDTLSFISSDAQRAEQLTELLHLYYDPAENRSGQTLANSGTMSWFYLAQLGNLPLGTIGSENLLFFSNFGLLASRTDAEGYMFETFNGPFWAFPDYTYSQGDLTGWEFNGNNPEGWSAVNATTVQVQNGRWTVTTLVDDPLLISPTVSVAAEDSPFVEVRMRCLDSGVDCANVTGQLFWQRSDATDWSAERVVSFELLDPGDNPGVDTITYAVPVFQHPEWTGTITRLRLDPFHSGQVNRTAEIDRVVFAYDSRLSTTNVNYTLAAAEFYFSSGNSQFFTSNSTSDGTRFERARKAMNYVKMKMGGGTNNFVKLDWPQHDGLPGRVGGQIQRGQGIQSSFACDAWPVGNEDAYASIYYYAALRAIAALEREAAAHPEWNVAPNAYGETAQSYDAKAASVKAAVSANFWLPTEGRLMSARDVNNVVRDMGHTGMNLEAIFLDAIDSTKAASVVDWVSGNRTVAGDDSQGADIYAWDFAPRTNTKDASDWYVWPMYIWFGINLTNGPGALFNQQVANGGGWFWYSFYDVLARIQVNGPNDAWQRLTGILDWFEATQAAGGFVPYYNTHPGILQGCNSAGSLGLDCEFIENGLVPLSALYGFLGYRVSEEGLRFSPALPSDLSMLGVERLQFRKHFYTIRASSSSIAPFELETYPETGVAGYENSAHQLPLQVGSLQPSTDYLLSVTNTDTASTSNSIVTTDADGVLSTVVSMPANGILEVELGGSAVIFIDGFESGDTSVWD